MTISIWIGWDPRQAAEFAVARASAERFALKHWPVRGLVLSQLRAAGLYRRPMEVRAGVDGPEMWDTISGARQSTEHANSRFLVPHLARQGWAMFADGDTMFCSNLPPLFASLESRYALYCVHHRYEPANATKMDGQVQQRYGRKNWSSVMIFNCDHPANDRLTLDLVNTVPGRDLHRFCWLEDRHIGELPASWNHLVGESDASVAPDIIHWTNGTPAMKGYENTPFADDWRDAREAWAAGGALSLPG